MPQDITGIPEALARRESVSNDTVLGGMIYQAKKAFPNDPERAKQVIMDLLLKRSFEQPQAPLPPRQREVIL